MTTEEKTARVREMQRQWYRTFSAHGETVADEELESAMRDYFRAMDEAAR